MKAGVLYRIIRQLYDNVLFLSLFNDRKRKWTTLEHCLQIAWTRSLMLIHGWHISWPSLQFQENERYFESAAFEQVIVKFVTSFRSSPTSGLLKLDLKARDKGPGCICLMHFLIDIYQHSAFSDKTLRSLSFKSVELKLYRPKSFKVFSERCRVFLHMLFIEPTQKVLSKGWFLNLRCLVGLVGSIEFQAQQTNAVTQHTRHQPAPQWHHYDMDHLILSEFSALPFSQPLRPDPSHISTEKTTS